jgi:hypothetical protein
VRGLLLASNPRQPEMLQGGRQMAREDSAVRASDDLVPAVFARLAVFGGLVSDQALCKKRRAAPS